MTHQDQLRHGPGQPAREAGLLHYLSAVVNAVSGPAATRTNRQAVTAVSEIAPTRLRTQRMQVKAPATLLSL